MEASAFSPNNIRWNVVMTIALVHRLSKKARKATKNEKNTGTIKSPN